MTLSSKDNIGPPLSNGISPDLVVKYIVLFCGIIGSSILLYYSSIDSKSTTTFMYVYAISIFMLLSYATYFGLLSNLSSNILGLIVFIAIATTALYFYSNMYSSSLGTVNILINIVLVLIVLVGLAMIFYMLSNYFKSYSGTTGFVINLIFYIPCLLIDFTKYIMKELKLTEKIIYVFFLVELVLILLYIYIPKLVKHIDNKTSIPILEGGSNLDTSHIIGTSEILTIPENKLVNNAQHTVYSDNYAFSMWIYLRNLPSNFVGYSKETTIFNLGEGKIKVAYSAQTEGAGKYIIYFTNKLHGQKPYEISVPNQKWNNFVINYSSQRADLFVNGVLKTGFSFDNNFPTFNPTDLIVVGSKNGLDGAIYNVRYFPENLSESYIINMYNLLMYRNPPTFSS